MPYNASAMSYRILLFYGSYRSDRMGIRLAQFVLEGFRARGHDAELIDAKAVGLPMLDRMYKEHPKGAAPEPMEKLAHEIRSADGFVFITGEYNWGIQPGLKNLTDHFLEEWFWRPAAIASYSAGRFAGARAATAWHGTLSEMGMVVVSSTIAVGPIARLELIAVDDSNSTDNPSADSLIEAQIPAQQFKELGLREGETLVVTPRNARVFVEQLVEEAVA